MFHLPSTQPFTSTGFSSAASMLRYGKCWYQMSEDWQDLVYPYLPLLENVSDEVFIRSGGAVLIKLAPLVHATSGKLADELPTDAELATIGSVAATAIELFKSGAQIPELDAIHQLKLFMEAVGMDLFTREFRLGFRPVNYMRYREDEIADGPFLQSIVDAEWYAAFYSHCYEAKKEECVHARSHMPVARYKAPVFWTVDRLYRVIKTWNEESLRELAAACQTQYATAPALMSGLSYRFISQSLLNRIENVMPHEAAW